jgi:hypothetical protein
VWLLKVDTHTSPPKEACLVGRISPVGDQESAHGYMAHISYLGEIYTQVYPMFLTFSPGISSNPGQSISRAALPWQRSLDQVEVVGRTLGASS